MLGLLLLRGTERQQPAPASPRPRTRWHGTRCRWCRACSRRPRNSGAGGAAGTEPAFNAVRRCAIEPQSRLLACVQLSAARLACGTCSARREAASHGVACARHVQPTDWTLASTQHPQYLAACTRAPDARRRAGAPIGRTQAARRCSSTTPADQPANTSRVCCACQREDGANAQPGGGALALRRACGSAIYRCACRQRG
jgi:hypothetical protein